MVSPKKGSKLRVNKVEWLERVIAIQRVTKVVKGGKKLSFRAIVVVGDEMGKVGVGVGKANDVITAVRKGSIEAVYVWPGRPGWNADLQAYCLPGSLGQRDQRLDRE